MYWVAIAILVLIGDYYTPPYLQFTIISLIPIALSSWYSGWRWGVPMALVLTVLRAFIVRAEDILWPIQEIIANTLNEAVMLALFSILISRLAIQHRKLLKEVQILEGLLPICMHCKKIRNAEDSWEPLEKYITEHSEAQFSHGLCADCAKKHYGDYLKKNTRG